MPVVEPFEPFELGPKDWGTELVFAATDVYLGKMSHMKAGHGGPLQLHERKRESFYFLSGEALVEYIDESGDLVGVRATPGMAWHVPPGAPHRVTAITDCVILEASTPVYDDRVSVPEPT